jgi:hypothetical protein
MAARNHRLMIRLSDPELETFSSLADHYGVTIPALMRMLVKRDHTRRVRHDEKNVPVRR